MKLRNHDTRAEARRELSTNGYVTAFSSPGRPELWMKPGAGKNGHRYAVGRETRQRSEKWHVVEYPEPAVCTPEQLPELVGRDGPLMNGEKGISDEFAWLL